jgi:hypothetical protein
MHKLFSLLDEIYALERLGLTALTKLTEVFKSAVRGRFAEQASATALVASDRVGDWSWALVVC